MENKYNSLADFRKANQSEYDFLKHNKLVDKLCDDMGWKKSIPRPNKPGYWTKERCIEEALKYTNKNTWKIGNQSSLHAARKNGWLDECTIHMIIVNKPVGYWTKEKLIDEAKKWETTLEWKKLGEGYRYACAYGLLDEVTTHMMGRIPKGYWTKERCLEDALKYNLKSEWIKNCASPYNISKKNGWLDECTAHMVEGCKPAGYWNKERCLEEVLKYKTTKEWQKNSKSSYNSAYKNKWLGEFNKLLIKRKSPASY